MKKRDAPTCACGSKEAGLIWISEENRYQCGTCIQKVYAGVASTSSKQGLKITDPNTGGSVYIRGISVDE